MNTLIITIKKKIAQLEIEKDKLRKSFDEYEARDFLDNYAKLNKIDGAIEVLKELLLKELEIERIMKKYF